MPYRIINTPVILGKFNGPFGSGVDNAQIPFSRIPERFREVLTNLPNTQGVGAIAELIRGKDFLQVPWPADVLPYIGQGDIYANMYLVQAIRYVSVSSVRNILDQVQNRVLNFVLELESRNPEAGEAITKSPKIPEDQVRNIFHTVINGAVQNLGHTSTQDKSITIGGNVTNSQVGQSLTHCTNLIQQQVSGQRKVLLEHLQEEAKALIGKLPTEKQEDAADNLERFVKEATAEKPNRRWYSVSAEGLLEASKFVKDFSGNLSSTIGQLGKMIWPDFSLSPTDEKSSD